MIWICARVGVCRADQVAALVQLSGVPFVAVAPKVGHPLAHIPAVAVLSEELGNTITALACAARAFNPQHVRGIAEGEIRSGHESVERLDP